MFNKQVITVSAFFICLILSSAKTVFTAEFAIATQQSLQRADVSTHEISSGGVILGISEFGGGYINKLVIPGVGDIISKEAARYGRGGQVSIRDNLHGGRYNPTQAGFSDTAGTNCIIEKISNNILVIPPRPAALYNGDRRYDFTEWENLAADPYLEDGGNSDSDMIDESNLDKKQEAEITSEFDFTGHYKNVRDEKYLAIPAFQFSYEFRFIRYPGHALRQFKKGTLAYDSSVIVEDRSNIAPSGKHPSSEDSLTDIILSCTLRGDKVVWNPKIIFLLDNESKITVTQPKDVFRFTFLDNSKYVGNPLLILSESEDPNHGPAIGFYHPDNNINNLDVLGRSIKNDSVSYEDNRVKKGILLGNLSRTKNMWLFGMRTNHSGLLNRNETPDGIYESIRGESYILIGTPNEIIAAARIVKSFL